MRAEAASFRLTSGEDSMTKLPMIALLSGAALATLAIPVQAKDDPVELVRCEQSIGTIALVDGDQAGWTEWGLSSPRELITALAVESNCFTPHSPASGTPARYLITAIAGSQEEVDKGVEYAKAGATEALLRSGAAGSVLSKVPFGGAALGMFGGLGGKKKTVAAGLRVVSPSTGQTIAAGSGSVKKSSLSFGGNSWASTAAAGAGYQGSKNGQMLTEAFVLAFNQLVAQRSVLDSAPAAGNAATSASVAVVAVDTKMRSASAANAAEVRTLRAGTELTPTGERNGLWLEVADNFGTKGWVSVEDLK